MAVNYEPTSNELWVSTNGSNANSGTKNSPFRTIQKAINEAEPGTSIYVKSGTYNENLVIAPKVNLDLKNTTTNKSLALISVDGDGAAIIKSPTTKSTIEILSMHDLVVDGFRIVGNGAGTNDEAPVKITGGATIYNDSGNIHLLNNTFAGNGVDAIKAINTNEIVVRGNTFNGNFKQQVVDFVAVSDSDVSYNLVKGIADSGLTFKGGSSNTTVVGNHITMTSSDGNGPGIKIGGEGFNRTLSETPVELRGFEAKNFTVSHNVVETGAGKFALLIQGGQNSDISDNYFGNSGSYAIRISKSQSGYGNSESKYNTVEDNILRPNLKLYVEQGSANPVGNTFKNNVTDSLSSVGFEFGIGAASDAGGAVVPDAPSESVTLSVKVGGTGTDAAPPEFSVFADGKKLGTREVADPILGTKFALNNDALYDTFSFNLNDGTPDTVEIVYTNDGKSGGVNRDLVVDYIQIGGDRLESEKDGYFEADNGKAVFEGARERLHVNGTLVFDDLL